jgi:hypothetical protein
MMNLSMRCPLESAAVGWELLVAPSLGQAVAFRKPAFAGILSHHTATGVGAVGCLVRPDNPRHPMTDTGRGSISGCGAELPKYVRSRARSLFCELSAIARPGTVKLKTETK